MRRSLIPFLLLLAAAGPSPSWTNGTFSGTLGVTGAATLSGGGTLTGSFAGGTFTGTTMTTPTINGGALSGTFTGVHTYSGATTLSGGGTLSGTFAGTPTWSGLNSFTAGISFSGGSFAAGSITTDTNWGGYIKGRSGATADVALVTSGGVNALKVVGANIPFSGAAAGAVELANGLLVGLPGGGTNITWTGSSFLPPNVALMSFANWTGTAGASGDIPLNFLDCNSDALNAPSSPSVDCLGIVHNVTAGALGSRVGAYFKLFQRAQNGRVNSDYVALSPWGEMDANDGGTARTQAGASGAVWGETALSIIGAAATYVRGQAGIEVDVGTYAPLGQGPLARQGVFVLNYTNNVSTGYTIDNAFAVGSQTAGAPTWHYGYAIGYSNSEAAIDPNGVGFGMDASQVGGVFTAARNTIGWLYDGINGTYNGGLIRGPSFRVLGTGQTNIGTLAVSSSGATSAIDTTQFVGDAKAATFSGGTLTSGGSGMIVGMYLSDTWGGRYICSTVVTGACTVITVYAQPSDSSSHSGAVTLTPDNTALVNGAGGTITVVEAWTAGTTLNLGTSAATAVNIGNATANVLLGSGSALATNATVGFPLLPTTTAAPTGTVGAAGKSAYIVRTDNHKICHSEGSGTWYYADGTSCI